MNARGPMASGGSVIRGVSRIRQIPKSLNQSSCPRNGFLRLDIAMDNFGRMSAAQRARNLLGDLQHGVDGVLLQA